MIKNYRNIANTSLRKKALQIIDAAGAVVDNSSLEKAKSLKLDYKRYLKNNDSYHFFKKMDDLVITGLTGSNVADIGVLICN